MKGDFSRSTFRSDKHYSHVLIEQGRVQVDADWNEQQEILHHRLNTEVLDLIGQSGTSIKNNGFLISLSADGKSLTIGKGRFFVDGILCENEAGVPYLNQPDLPNPPGMAGQGSADQRAGDGLESGKRCTRMGCTHRWEHGNNERTHTADVKHR